MKKKFLSLMMAAAMVATTSVSAFANNIKTTEIDIPGDEHTQNVTVTGEVAKDDGTLPEGNLHVTVPTAVSFTVMKGGKDAVKSADMTVTNHGKEKIQVTVKDFSDATGDGITVKKPNETLGSAKKDNITLSLQGTSATAYFATEKTSSGVYNLAGEEQKDGIMIAEIEGGLDAKLSLKGDSGTADVDAPVGQDFTVRLLIKKLSRTVSQQ